MIILLKVVKNSGLSDRKTEQGFDYKFYRRHESHYRAIGKPFCCSD